MRWSLPSPPIAGLHDIVPSWSRLKLTRATDAPSRAAAAAASVPAWPPPTTTISKLSPMVAHLGRCSTWNNPGGRDGVTLLADAEACEQGIEHVLDSGPP